MKITVLTILILMLMAGLAIVQMDANTENQIQVLSETEMLTTQGLGACQLAQHGPDDDGECADKACYVVLPLPHIVAKHEAMAYKRCKDPSPNNDCIEVHVFNENGEELAQVCVVKKYYFFSCETGTFFKAVPVEKPFFGTVPGCVGLDVDGGSSTSS